MNVFISYSHEDSQIAAAVFAALERFNQQTDFYIAPVWDRIAFRQGGNITDETIKNLEKSQVFIFIYTNSGRRSPWVNEEVAIFKFLMLQERRTHGTTVRRLIPIYTDKLPETLDQTLGIKLDTSVIARSTTADREIDPANGFQRFFKDLLRDFPNPDDNRLKPEQKLFKQQMQVKAVDDIVQDLLRDLRLAFSDVVSTLSIEQKALTINWPAGLSQLTRQADILAGSSLRVETPDVFQLFGMHQDNVSLEWAEFKLGLMNSYDREHCFIIESLSEAVRSGLEIRPVDNDQFFLGHDGVVYRIIVTRHFHYYNGRRIMHVYFIPILNPFGDKAAFVELGMLTAATRFKTAFLEDESETAVDAFVGSIDDDALFQQLVSLFHKNLVSIDHLSHAFRLDDRSVVKRYFRDELSATKIAEMFQSWRLWHDDILAGIRDVRQAASDDADAMMRKGRWIDLLRRYLNYVRAINGGMGRIAASRLLQRFDAHDAVEANSSETS